VNGNPMLAKKNIFFAIISYPSPLTSNVPKIEMRYQPHYNLLSNIIK